MSARKLSISCHKGGVGKTTSAASIGGILSLGGQRVLLIDIDPQGNLTSSFMDGPFERTIYDCFKEFRSGRRGNVPDLPIYNIRENLDIVPSSIAMFSVDSVVAAEMDKANILRRLVAKVEGSYDWIIIDCPAQLGLVTANALIAAGNVLVPMTCDAFSADGLQQLESFIDNTASLNPEIEITGIFLTRFDRRRQVDVAVAKELEERWGDVFFKTRIRTEAQLVKAALLKQDIGMYNPKCRGAQDYLELLGEIVRKFDNQ